MRACFIYFFKTSILIDDVYPQSIFHVLEQQTTTSLYKINQIIMY